MITKNVPKNTFTTNKLTKKNSKDRKGVKPGKIIHRNIEKKLDDNGCGQCGTLNLGQCGTLNIGTIWPYIPEKETMPLSNEKTQVHKMEELLARISWASEISDSNEGDIPATVSYFD